MSKNKAYKQFKIGRATQDHYLKKNEDGHVTKYNMKTKNVIFFEDRGGGLSTVRHSILQDVLVNHK